MASRKKESEGIALLSIYGDGDDDDEMEDAEEDEPEKPIKDAVNEEIKYSNYTVSEDHEDDGKDNLTAAAFGSGPGNDDGTSNQQRASDDNSTPKTSNLAISAPQQSEFLLSSPPPPPPSAPSTARAIHEGRLTIVDYEHDEGAISPRAEEGEIVGTGRVMFGEDLQAANGDLQERTFTGDFQSSTPVQQATPQHVSEQLDLLSDPMKSDINDPDSIEAAVAVNDSTEEPKYDDPLNKFLLPPPKTKCSRELQEKIIKFLSLKKTTGRSFNSEVRNRKEYRNPDFLLHAVTYQDIDQIGSCFCKDVFDPYGYDKSDYYNEIEADMKREMERKEQERKKSQKVDFVSGGTHTGTVGSAPNINIPIPGLSTMIPGGLQSFPAAADMVARDGRQNKKSKWDKVDLDQRNPLPSGGQDSVSAAGANAALLSAANAGAGYTAFAQQKRREAEDKRSSEKRMDRRS